jgi:hypothetical protein
MKNFFMLTIVTFSLYACESPSDLSLGDSISGEDNAPLTEPRTFPIDEIAKFRARMETIGELQSPTMGDLLHPEEPPTVEDRVARLNATDGAMNIGPAFNPVIVFDTNDKGSTTSVDYWLKSVKANDGVRRLGIASGTSGNWILSLGPTGNLAVEGNFTAPRVRTAEVVVDSQWADYVFNEDYELMSLDHVESFIAENKHLPGVPSAAQIEAEGVSVGESQATLLAKIEELTLYAIDQNRRIKKLEKRLGNNNN